MVRSSRRRPLRSALVLTALCALVSPAVSTRAVASEETPRTGFEKSEGRRWTTLAEEADFLRAVDEARPRVSVQRIGSSVRQRPLRLVRLGSRTSDTTVLFVCSQHGDEPAPREACLSTLRDLAYSQDPRVTEFLRETSVLFLPTANPDGRAADTRENAAGLDINRDHLELASPEARALARVMRDHQPDVVHDLHEYGGTPPYYAKDLLALWSRNLNVAPAVHAESRRLSQQYVRAAAEKAGHTTGVYGIWTDPETGEPIKQVAGSGQERILRNTIGIKNAVGVLAESRIEPLNEAEKADPALNHRRRVRTHLAAVDGTTRMLAERRAEIESATTSARRSGWTNSGPVYVSGADNEPPAPEDVLQDPPCGYRLSAERFGSWRDELRLHGVWSLPTPSGGRFVPMHQQARSVIPLLLDPRAEYHVTTATPVPCGA